MFSHACAFPGEHVQELGLAEAVRGFARGVDSVADCADAGEGLLVRLRVWLEEQRPVRGGVDEGVEDVVPGEEVRRGGFGKVRGEEEERVEGGAEVEGGVGDGLAGLDPGCCARGGFGGGVGSDEPGARGGEGVAELFDLVEAEGGVEEVVRGGLRGGVGERDDCHGGRRGGVVVGGQDEGLGVWMGRLGGRGVGQLGLAVLGIIVVGCGSCSPFGPCVCSLASALLRSGSGPASRPGRHGWCWSR